MSDRPIQTLIVHQRGIDGTPSTYRLVETTHECQHWNAEMFYLHHHPSTMGGRLLLKIHERKTGDTPSIYRLDECDEPTTNWYVDEQRLRRCNAEMSDKPSDPDPTVEELASEESATEESATTASHQKEESGHSCKSCASYERGFEKGWKKAWRMAKDMGMVNVLATES